MNIKCPHCESEYEIDESIYGRFVRCEVCGTKFVAGTSVAKEHEEEAKVKNTRVNFESRIYSGLTAMSDSAFICLGNDPIYPWEQSRSSSEGTNAEGTQEQDKLHTEIEKLRGVYVCTHCGEKSTSPKRTWLGFLGCLVVIAAFVCGGIFGKIHPLIGFAIFITTFAGAIVNSVRAGKTYCRKCGKYDTMISAISPQGMRLLREFGHIDDAKNVENNIQQSVTERLNQTRKLLDAGLISEQEYEIQRQRILDSI